MKFKMGEEVIIKSNPYLKGTIIGTGLRHADNDLFKVYWLYPYGDRYKEDELEKIESVTKPPLGLTPKYIWQEQRLQNIKEAIDRYKTANFEIPKEWIDEYNELIKIINKERGNLNE